MADQDSFIPPESWGEEVTSWELTKNTIRPPRTFVWYVVFGLILLGLFVFSITTKNFLFAILIVIFAFILIFERFNTVSKVRVGLYATGISVNDNIYPFSDFTSFRIMYEPPLKNLYLDRASIVNPHMVFPLEETDPIALREFLLEMLPEDLEKEGETFTSKVQRWLRL